MTQQPEDFSLVVSPQEAARLLGIAPATLRRLSPTYEEVFGKLPWEGKATGGGRMWPMEAVERVRAARGLLAEGRVKSLGSALRALEGGAQPSVTPSRPPGDAALAELFEELATMREGFAEVKALRAEVAELRRELAERPQISLVAPREVEQPKGAEAPPEALTAERGEPAVGLGERFGRRVDGLLRRFRSRG